MDNRETPETASFPAGALELQGEVHEKKKEAGKLQAELAKQFPSFVELITSHGKQSTSSDYLKQWTVHTGITSYTVTEPNTTRYPNAASTIEIQTRSHKRGENGEMFLIDTRWRLDPDGKVAKTISQMDTNQSEGQTTHMPFSITPDHLSDSLHHLKEFRQEIENLQDHFRM